MKKSLILFLFVTVGAFAQGKNHQKIKVLKTAFIIEQLSLTPSEAEKFWPVYNAHEAEIIKLRRDERVKIFQAINNGVENLSDIEANSLIDDALNMRELQYQYEKDLVNNLRGILSPQKLLKLKKVEHDFKKQLIEKLRQRREKNK
jgi:hypothetical protein